MIIVNDILLSLVILKILKNRKLIVLDKNMIIL